MQAKAKATPPKIKKTVKISARMEMDTVLKITEGCDILQCKPSEFLRIAVNRMDIELKKRKKRLNKPMDTGAEKDEPENER